MRSESFRHVRKIILRSAVCVAAVLGLVCTVLLVARCRIHRISQLQLQSLSPFELHCISREITCYRHLCLIRSHADWITLCSVFLEATDRAQAEGDFDTALRCIRTALSMESDKEINPLGHIVEYRLLANAGHFHEAALSAARYRRVLERTANVSGLSRGSIALTYGLEAYAYRKLRDSPSCLIALSMGVRHLRGIVGSSALDGTTRDAIAILNSQAILMQTDPISPQLSVDVWKINDALVAFGFTNGYVIASQAELACHLGKTNEAQALMAQAESERGRYAKLFGIESPGQKLRGQTKR